MIKVPLTEELSDFNLRDYVVPSYVDRRGYMYILFDRVFPDFIKVGRTSDVRKRLMGYNSDKPFPTARMLYISKLFEDVNDTERKILEYMYDNTAPSTLSREWFEIEHKQMIIDIIEKAELQTEQQSEP